MVHEILKAYGLDNDAVKAKPFGTGLINHTWIVESGDDKFILQRINQNVFKNPFDINMNIQLMGSYLEKCYPDYLFIMPVNTLKNEHMIHVEGEGYFRMFPFVKGSRSIEVVKSVQQAYEAAKQFGKFTNHLSGFPSEKLRRPLPDFHNLNLRYQQFDDAIKNCTSDRLSESITIIKYLKQQKHIAETYRKICSDKNFKLRVTHHDTKISNVLFNQEDRGLCVIDLDTVMTGYFISDVGDMLRTYLSPVSEEEKDFNQVAIRNEYFEAIADGYLGEMKDELTAAEREHFLYSGKFMIYMQALRFLTDHLNNDSYYGAKYEGHNFIRASNQAALLQRLTEKEKVLMVVQ